MTRHPAPAGILLTDPSWRLGRPQAFDVEPAYCRFGTTQQPPRLPDFDLAYKQAKRGKADRIATAALANERSEKNWRITQPPPAGVVPVEPPREFIPTYILASGGTLLRRTSSDNPHAPSQVRDFDKTTWKDAPTTNGSLLEAVNKGGSWRRCDPEGNPL